MKLVNDAASWWRWHSSRVFALLAVLPVVWASSPDLQAMIPPKWAASLGAAISLLGLVGRVVKQGADADAPETVHVPQPFDSDTNPKG